MLIDMPVEELITYRGSTPRPDDFDAFWDASLAESDAMRGISGKRSGNILVERWGTSPETGLYLTCRNTSKQEAEVVLTFKESDFLGLSSAVQHAPNQAMMEEAARKKISEVSELVDGNEIVMEKNGETTTLRFTLPAERTQVINLR